MERVGENPGNEVEKKIMAERTTALVFRNILPIVKHLRDRFHIVKQGENGETLLKHNANINKKNLPFSWNTCFLKPMENEDGSIQCTPIEEEELLPLLEKAVKSGHKLLQDDGRIQAIYRSHECIGVFPTFRNKIDETDGFEIKRIYAIKVVYNKLTDRDDIIDGITAYPLFYPSQESY